MLDAAVIVAALEATGHRLTAPRRQLADVIASQVGHFTAEDLHSGARRRGVRVGRATIFRSLDVLTELGLIERLDLPSGEHAYVGCLPAHHHHIVCSRCGRSTGVTDLGLESVAERVSRTTGYRVDTHRLELYGLCPVCQAGAAPAPVDEPATT
jgi:Fe2+ or Zn2+ uptake regulation protein